MAARPTKPAVLSGGFLDDGPVIGVNCCGGGRAQSTPPAHRPPWAVPGGQIVGFPLPVPVRKSRRRAATHFGVGRGHSTLRASP